tara:strand:+ start:294 stop:491 length:198 start_codon:yes stop_codon:yes gene_type:complete
MAVLGRLMLDVDRVPNCPRLASPQQRIFLFSVASSWYIAQENPPVVPELFDTDTSNGVQPVVNAS